MSLSHTNSFVGEQGGVDRPVVISFTDESSKEGAGGPTPRVLRDEPPVKGKVRKIGGFWVGSRQVQGFVIFPCQHLHVMSFPVLLKSPEARKVLFK